MIRRAVMVLCVLLAVGAICRGEPIPAGAAVVLGAQESTNATVITSDQLTFDYKRSIADFNGQVNVKDTRLNLCADRLIVTFDEASNIRSATAVGGVVITDSDKRATCRKAIYLVQVGEVILTGEPVVTRGKDQVSGNRITLWPDQDRVVVDRGKLVIEPGQDRSGLALPGVVKQRKSTESTPRARVTDR